jgi:putative tricarboxylic transport membrane protein
MTREDWQRSWKAWLRGTAIGFPLGVLPMRRIGDSHVPVVHHEKRLSKRPSSSATARSKASRAPSREQRAGRGCSCRC